VVRYLFLTWDGGGNQPPALGLAEAARAGGDAVLIAGSEDQRSLFVAAGFEFLVLPAPPPLPHENRFATHLRASWINDQLPRRLSELKAAGRFDVLVVDCLMVGALAAAEAQRLATAVLVHSAPNALVPVGGELERMLLGPMNQMRAGLDLPTLGRLAGAWDTFPCLCTTIPELDPPGEVGGLHLHFVGPIRPQTPGAPWRSPWAESDPRPLVLVAFSTGRAWDQTSRIRRTIAALADAPYRLVVTAAGAEIAGLEPAENLAVVERVDHGLILPHASAAIIHGGHGVLSASLAHGAPVVCLPNLGADQVALGRHVQHLGAGLVLDGDTAAPPDIRAALERVTRDPAFARAAHVLAEQLRLSGGGAEAYDVMSRIVRSAPQ